MKHLLPLILLFLPVIARAQQPWTLVREEVIEGPRPTQGVQQIPLQIVLDSNSVWARPNEINSQISKASQIFRKCGIELGRVEIRYVNYTDRAVTALNNHDPYKGPSEMVLMNGELSQVRPAVFLMGDQIPSTAKAFTRRSIDNIRRTQPQVDALLHTTLISGHHAGNRPVPGAHPSYSTLAHELAHLLGNLDHVDEADNLMSSREGRNSKSGNLNASQCQSIREYSLANFSGLKSSPDCP